MKRFLLWSPIKLLLCVVLTSCNPAAQKEESKTDNPAENSNTQQTNRIDIPRSVRDNLGITFASVERRNVANTIRVPGAFELHPLARHEYRLMLSGRIEFLVDQFDEIQPGTALYRFRSPKWPELQQEILNDEQAIAKAEVQVEVAEAALAEAISKFRTAEARVEALAQAEFKRADLEAQVTEWEAAIPRLEAELRVARTSLNHAEQALSHAVHRASSTVGLERESLFATVAENGSSIPHYQTIDWITVHATEPGVVESLAITDGTFVEATTLVLTTVNPRRVRFRAMGLQSDRQKFETGQMVRIVPPQSEESNINEAVMAELTIGLEADPGQRTVTLFASPEELRPWTAPGVSAFLEIETESSDGQVLAIPRSAVVRDGIRQVLFRRAPDNPNQAIRQEADLGVDDGRWVEVKSGLGPDDEVVLQGAYELKLATALEGTTQQGGHFHADGSYHGEH